MNSWKENERTITEPVNPVSRRHMIDTIPCSYPGALPLALRHLCLSAWVSFSSGTLLVEDPCRSVGQDSGLVAVTHIWGGRRGVGGQMC